jgi:zinc transporter ZupT
LRQICNCLIKLVKIVTMLLPVTLAFLTFISTLLGGLTAIKNRDRLHRILGFTAGVLLAVVAFDILPEIFELVSVHNFDPIKPMVALVVAFLCFHILEKGIIMHHAHETEYGKHRHPQVGLLSALALSGHSFLDGVGIGLGFQVSNQVGMAVAVAVIAHDFSDGLNTVSLMLSHKNSLSRSIRLLVLDAVAPVLGAISTLFFTLGPSGLVLYLGFFAGFLLYIGASDILPEAHSEHSSWGTIFLTIAGAVFIFVVTRFV